MAFPEPVPGLVISYSYLWWREHERGQEEGVKDRSCAIVSAVARDQGQQLVTVLPVTHTPPADPGLAVEIPYVTKQRLGLDTERSWVVLTEANRFVWPGPDLRIREPRSDPPSVVYGLLPRALFKEITGKFIKAAASGATRIARRTQ